MKNDQAKLIQAIKDDQVMLVWSMVRHIGYKQVPDMEERFIYFNKAYHDFDPYRNNNFIHFYKRYLGYLKFDKNRTFRLTDSNKVIKLLQRQSISPEKVSSKIVNELKYWGSGVDEN